MSTVGYVLIKGLKYGTILGALYGTCVFALIGTLYGAFFGAIMGLILGLVDGLIIGLVTNYVFHPVQDVKLFRWTVIILAAVVTYIGAVIFLLKLYSISALSDYFVQVPALIASGSAVYAVRGFVRHYIKQHEKTGKRKYSSHRNYCSSSSMRINLMSDGM